MHLGLGAFHRAHQAIATKRAMAAEPGDWGIVGVSLTSPRMRDALLPQGCRYTLLQRGPDGTTAELVDVLTDVLFGPADPAAVVRRLADPATRIVTLTITEKGYCLDAASVRLDAAHSDIAHDLAHPHTPRSAIGLLVAALADIRAAGHRPPAVLSCDNLAANGATLRQAVLDLAAARNDAFSAWIAGAVPFPSSMVDRIVPATTDADRAEAFSLTGWHDAAPVVAEPFFQWEIEAFDGPRPLWEAGGARFVADVVPWEATKLRLLNGAHSAMAYLGGLAGLGTVADAVADPIIRRFIRELMLQEAAATLPPGAPDAAAYTNALFARWANPAIRHRLAQIAMDGSRKLPQRLLAPLAINLAAGRPAPRTCLAVAAWMRWSTGTGLDGAPTAVSDPLAAQMHGLDPDGFLALTEVFGPASPPALRDALAGAWRDLHAFGALGAMQRVA